MDSSASLYDDRSSPDWNSNVVQIRHQSDILDHSFTPNAVMFGLSPDQEYHEQAKWVNGFHGVFHQCHANQPANDMLHFQKAHIFPHLHHLHCHYTGSDQHQLWPWKLSWVRSWILHLPHLFILRGIILHVHQRCSNIAEFGPISQLKRSNAGI